MAAMKSSFENRISNLTKEVNDNAQQLKNLSEEVAEKTKLVEQLMTEKAELQEKVTHSSQDYYVKFIQLHVPQSTSYLV